MEIKGDPSELAFTEMLTRHFGWKSEGDLTANSSKLLVSA
jgi:hypothetical protein